MSTFLAASFHPAFRSEKTFARALSVLHELKRQVIATRHGERGLHVALLDRLARKDGGSAFAIDPARGTWLALAGTWMASGNLSVEELVDLFVARGPDALAKRLEGAFTAIAGDPRSSTLDVITDPVGSHHAFVHPVVDGVFVSSSSLALSALDDANALDPIGAQEFLRTGTIYEDRTIHASVRRLAAGAIHSIVAGRTQPARTWWDARAFSVPRLEGARAAEALGETLESTVKRVTPAGAKAACDLTGGYDSRTIFVACLAAGIDVVPTVTGHPHSKDVVVARDVAAAAGMELLHVPPSTPATLERVHDALRVTDGEYDLVEYGQILAVHEHLSAAHAVSLNGSAGEISRGKQFPFALRELHKRSSAFVPRMVATRYVEDEATPDLFRAADRFDRRPHFEGVLGRTLDGWDDLPASARVDAIYLMRMRVWQGRIASSTDQVWRCLSPFLSRSVLETTLQIRPLSRLGSATVRRYLWSRARAISLVPLSRGYPPVPFGPRTAHAFASLPGHFLDRAWRKITRGRAWNPELPQHAARVLLLDRPEVRELLDPRSMRSAPFFEPQALEHFLESAASASFGFDGQWRRLLSLECALRQRETLRARVSARERAS